MEKIKEFEKNQDKVIYPVFYDNGILFKDEFNDSFFLFKENLIRELELKEITGDVLYPNTNEELKEIENVINFIFTRLSNSQLLKINERGLLKVIKKIKIASISTLAELNVVNQTAQVLCSSGASEEVSRIL
jgi:hypothetical protein